MAALGSTEFRCRWWKCATGRAGSSARSSGNADSDSKAAESRISMLYLPSPFRVLIIDLAVLEFSILVDHLACRGIPGVNYPETVSGKQRNWQIHSLKPGREAL